VGTDQIPVDEDLLNDLKPFDYDLDYSRKCIEANKHNHITASYNLLQKAKLREGKMTIKDAYECKNDLTSLMKRHPRFQNLNHNMPEHLKVSSRGDQKPSSMPPKTRIPKDAEDNIDRLNQTINPDKLIPKQLKIDSETEKEIKSKRRTGSTGGSSTKDAEIIGMEHAMKKGSPSPSPLGHPKFPMNKPPMLKHVLASGKAALKISDSSSSKNARLLKREKSNNSKNENSKNKPRLVQNTVDFANLFRNMQKNKKK
jgi:hypothetical protein